MLKYSFLLFVVAVAVDWSNAEAAPRQFISLNHNRDGTIRWPAIRKREATPGTWISLKHNRDGTYAGAITKRETEDEEKLLKQLSAGLLLLTVESSAEIDALEDIFAAAIEKKWDSIDDYANHLVKVYHSVTGRLPGEGIESDELLSRAIEFER